MEELREQTEQLLDLIDYKPLHTLIPHLRQLMAPWVPEDEREVSPALFLLVERWREQNADILSMRKDRHRAFVNALLTAQMREFAEHDINVVLSTFLRSSRTERSHYRELDSKALVRAEPDAGFTFSHQGEETISNYGWECDVATLVSNDPYRGEQMPDLVNGLRNTGPRINQLIADRAYLSMLDTDLAQNMRDDGMKLVMKYSADEEGRVAQTSGDAILVEGRWYSNGLPAHLVTARTDFKEASARNHGRNPETQVSIEERRDVLLAARRRYEVTPLDGDLATPAGELAPEDIPGYRPLPEVQHVTRFDDAGESLLSGEAAHAFITALKLVAHNMHVVTCWKEWRVLDEGNGLIEEQWWRLHRMVDTRIQNRMAQWSGDRQPAAVAAAEIDHGWGGHWVIDLDECPRNWTPDASTTVVQVVRANEETADLIATQLLERIMNCADDLLSVRGEQEDLSHEFRIELRFDFFDEFTMDDDDNFLPMPKGGLPLSADVVLVPTSLPRCSSVNR